MTRYARTEGVLIEPVGHVWAVFCPTTGETALLNDESVSILEVLETGAADTATICDALAEDGGVTAEAIIDLVEACWPQLIDAGLVREARAGHTTSR